MTHAAEPRGPRVSVIAPAYHSDATMGSFLEGLRRQRFRDFEAIVVNSSSDARTREIVVERLSEARFVQWPSRLLPHAARNRGVDVAHGELLVFTDPDCRPAPDWLERLVARSDQGHDVVVGAVDFGGQSTYERGVHLWKYAAWLPKSTAGPCAVAPSANVLYSRRAWEAVGPFPEDGYSGDTVLAWRAAASGHRPWFEPNAIVTHLGTRESCLGKSFERGADFARLRALHERRGRLWAAARLAALPAIPFVLAARTARNAVAAGWGMVFARTLPVQFGGASAWALGEARTHLRLVARGARGLS